MTPVIATNGVIALPSRSTQWVWGQNLDPGGWTAYLAGRIVTAWLVPAEHRCRDNLHHAGIDIVDARDPQYYSGASVSLNRAGHIASHCPSPEIGGCIAAALSNRRRFALSRLLRSALDSSWEERERHPELPVETSVK
jgi:hypothetical protein